MRILIALAIGCAGFAAAPVNVVHNGDFESEGGWQWMTSGAQADWKIDSHEAHSAKHSLLLTNKSGFAPNVYGRSFQNVRGLMPFTTYRISAWAKGKNVGIAWVGGGT